MRQRLVTACPGRHGTPPARHYDLCCEELAERILRRQCRRRKRGPRPKIATVERREAGAPRKVRTTPQQRGWSRFAGAIRFCAFSALRSPFGEKGKRETRR